MRNSKKSQRFPALIDGCRIPPPQAVRHFFKASRAPILGCLRGRYFLRCRLRGLGLLEASLAIGYDCVMAKPQFNLQRALVSVALFGVAFGCLRIGVHSQPLNVGLLVALYGLGAGASGAAFGVLFDRPFFGAAIGMAAIPTAGCGMLGPAFPPLVILALMRLFRKRG